MFVHSFFVFQGSIVFDTKSTVSIDGGRGVYIKTTDPSRPFDIIGLDTLTFNGQLLDLTVSGGDLQLESIQKSIVVEAEFNIEVAGSSVDVISVTDGVNGMWS